MPSRLLPRAALTVLPIVVVAVGGAAAERATTGNAVLFAQSAHPRVTNRCPTDALPLRRTELACSSALRTQTRTAGHPQARLAVHRLPRRPCDGSLPDLLHRLRPLRVPEKVRPARDRAHSRRFGSLPTRQLERESLLQRVPDSAYAPRPRRLGADALGEAQRQHHQGSFADYPVQSP